MTEREPGFESPQRLLDLLHETGIFALDDRDLPTAVDRAERAKQINPQLRHIREQAHRAARKIRDESRQHAYALLDELVQDLEVSLRAFITDPNARLPLYGTVIYEQEGHWHIGTPAQAEDWALQRQAQSLALKGKALDQALSDTRSKLKTAQRDLYRHDEAGRGIRIGVVGGLLLILGIALYVITRQPPVLGAAGIGLLLLGIAGAMFFRWRTRQRALDVWFDTLQQRGREQFKLQQRLQERQAQIAKKRDALKAP